MNILFKSKSSYDLDKLCISRGLNFSKLMENASKSAFQQIDEKSLDFDGPRQFASNDIMT